MEAPTQKAPVRRVQRKAERKVRSTLSCEACRSRKLKCNREQPCQNCTLRDDATTCVYRGGTVSKAAGRHVVHAEDMQQRIDRLESLVTTLVAQNQQQTGTNRDFTGSSFQTAPWDQITPVHSDTSDNDNGVEQIQYEVGVMQIDKNQSIYKGATHWYDVLEELNELKSLWGQVQDNQDGIAPKNPVPEYSDAPGLLWGMAKPVNREELIASLPPKPACDKLMARFFDEEESPVPTFHILHQPTFMKQYEEHFADPSKTPIMWIGLLFAILSPIMMSFHLNNDEPPEYEGVSKSLFELYRVRTSQCLMLGDITKAAPFTLETMIYNAMAEWARMSESESKVWMMMGLVARVAIQMGYHRDPSRYSEISVFQGEMRRRMWQFVHGSDSLTSFLVGLPALIRRSDIDTLPPRNLQDWELSEDMTVLPPTRPDSESTPCSYLLAKSNVLHCLGKITDFLSSLEGYPYEEVLKLDVELTAAADKIPKWLKMKSIGVTADQSMSVVNRCIQLEFLIHQGFCVLHRKFFSQGRLDSRFEPSYSRCIESAIALITQQYYLYKSAKESALVAKHWYRVSYTSHEFILAAMILVLNVRHRKMETAQGLPSCSMPIEVFVALDQASQVWGDEAAQAKSPEAIKVSQVLSNLLGTLRLCERAWPAPEDWAVVQQSNGESMMPGEQEGLMDIDWAVWDSFIEGTSFADAYGEMAF